jgi:hypothetical protein
LHPGYNRVLVIEAPGGCVMDIIMGLVRAGVTLAVIVVIIGLVAALFMIFFNLATGIDDRISE